MKLLFELTILILLSLFFYSCNEQDGTKILENGQREACGKVDAKFSECLNGTDFILSENPKTFIEWSYKDGILSINHNKAGFNCCFEIIEISFSIKDNIIQVKETDIGEKCHCYCTRDIEYKIRDIESGIYTIEIAEGLDIAGLNPIYFHADLKNGNSGSVEFDRPMYPWELQ